MKHRVISRTLSAVLVAAWFALPTAAHACTACMGDVNSKTAGAINAAMFLMIGVIGTMLASFGVFALYLSRRAAAPVPPHAEFDHSIPETDNLS